MSNNKTAELADNPNALKITFSGFGEYDGDQYFEKNSGVDQYNGAKLPFSRGVFDAFSRRVKGFTVTPVLHELGEKGQPHFVISVERNKEGIALSSRNQAQQRLQGARRSYPNEQVDTLAHYDDKSIYDALTASIKSTGTTSPKAIIKQIDEPLNSRIDQRLNEIKVQKSRAAQAASRQAFLARKPASDETALATRPTLTLPKAPAHAAPEAAPKAPAAPAPSVLRSISIPIKSLHSKSVHEFAQYMSTQHRSTAMRAFEDHPELGFKVKLNTKTENDHHFELEFDARNGEINMRKLHLAELLLTQLRVNWEKGRKINLERARDIVEDSLKDVREHYTENELGDRIAIVFASIAMQDNLSIAPTAPITENGTIDPDAPKPKEISLVQASGYKGRQFPSKEGLFTLAPWQQDDKGMFFEHIDEVGERARISPTFNQQAYIAALRDPDVKVVMVQAPSGSGKTLFGARIGLELLRIGAVKELLTERPTETTGGNYNPYLKGGMDEKFGVFSNVLDEEIAMQLGRGNTTKGMDTLEILKKQNLVRRYDQMYQRGDTLRYAFLLGDEMQNKDRVEIFHLMSRPGVGAKVVLVGDAEYQNDLMGRKSGFMQAFEIFSNPALAHEAQKRLRKVGIEIDPKTVTTLRFGAEDIRRSPHTAYIYEMNKLADEFAAFEEKQRQAARGAAPAPEQNNGEPSQEMVAMTAKAKRHARYDQHKNGQGLAAPNDLAPGTGEP